MKAVQFKYLTVPLAAFLFLAPYPAHASAEVGSTYLYSFGEFFRKIPYSDVRYVLTRIGMRHTSWRGASFGYSTNTAWNSSGSGQPGTGIDLRLGGGRGGDLFFCPRTSNPETPNFSSSDAITGVT